MRRFMILLVLIALSFLWAVPAAKGAGSYDFTTFDVPFAAPFSGAVNTDADGINNLGQVVGDYANAADNIVHGYLRDPNGEFTKIDVPPSLSQNSTYDFPPDLNNFGVIVGRYRVFSGPNLGEHCYVLIGGDFIPIPDVTFPHTPFPNACRGINDIVTPGQPVGQIVGDYRDSTFFHRHGFLLSGGTFSSIDFPGATNTTSRRINNQGQIVGHYWLDNGPFHGFLLSGGVFSAIDFPGAIETSAEDINNNGQIVGEYVDTDNHVHGFLFANGVFTTVALPGVIQNTDGSTILNLNFDVGIFGINDAGVITGTFLGPDGNFHGFVGVPQNSQQ